MPKCLIFDCDGTLVDSEFLANKALAIQLNALGIDLDPVVLMSRYRGWKLATILDDLSREFQINLPDNFVPAYRHKFSELSKRELKPIEGVIEVLEQISIPICVASSGPMHKIQESLDLTDLSRFFGDDLFSAYDVSSWKPDPALFLFAASQMGADPADCWVIEDSEVGIEAAVAAGMRPVYFAPDHVPDIQGDTVHIQHMSQLLDLLS